MTAQPIEPDERPEFATVDEAAAYWATRMAAQPVSDKQRERLISLFLD